MSQVSRLDTAPSLTRLYSAHLFYLSAAPPPISQARTRGQSRARPGPSSSPPPRPSPRRLPALAPHSSLPHPCGAAIRRDAPALPATLPPIPRALRARDCPRVLP